MIFERENIQDWNFGDLPETVEIESSGMIMQGYPALKQESGKVSLRLFASQPVAEHEMHFGLRALYKKVLGDEIRYMRRKLPGIQQLCLRFAAYGSCEELTEDIVNAAVDRTFINDIDLPRTRESFLFSTILQQKQAGFRRQQISVKRWSGYLRRPGLLRNELMVPFL